MPTEDTDIQGGMSACCWYFLVPGITRNLTLNFWYYLELKSTFPKVFESFFNKTVFKLQRYNKI